MLPRQVLDLLIERVNMRTKRSIMKSGMLRKASGERRELSPLDKRSAEED